MSFFALPSDSSGGISSSKPSVIRFFRKDYKNICAWTQSYTNIETGGDLYGLWDNAGNPTVFLATGPGKNCRREVACFFQDSDYLVEVADTLVSSYGLCHVGSWHSHHQFQLFHPSGGDRSSVWRGIGTDRYTMCIMNLVNEKGRSGLQTRMDAFCFVRETQEMESLNVAIMSGPSLLETMPDAHPALLAVLKGSEDPRILLASRKSEVNSVPWYQSDEGKPVLAHLIRELTELAGGAPTIQRKPEDISRLSLTATTPSYQIVVNIPSRFPQMPMDVSITSAGGATRDLAIPYEEDLSFRSFVGRAAASEGDGEGSAASTKSSASRGKTKRNKSKVKVIRKASRPQEGQDPESEMSRKNEATPETNTEKSDGSLEGEEQDDMDTDSQGTNGGERAEAQDTGAEGTSKQDDKAGECLAS
eukprot:CAMPEP_0119124848 /NCGR_PEP_ID=MMETSP1310-20130426/4335_1 /TAXON_ID=464262 /ORGANISM="Genus nov. species nov., Strain RCC2339" /LENGTH=417 /DNA_ID=CAMNT_0007114855 /DNA_START=47 /DNA_END=1300 /DNA_ORIENTATION=-